jgi:acetoin utilization protein AcuB
MRTDVISVKMDSKLGEAMELCASRRIRHLPVVNDQGKLAGLVTDRNLRSYVSPRVGTISENNADRETLDRRVHVIMIRTIVTGWSSMTLAQAAALMLDHRVGCLPVVDNERRLVGIVTTTDFLRIIAQP